MKKPPMSRSEEREGREREQMCWCRSELPVLEEKRESAVPGGRERERGRAGGEVKAMQEPDQVSSL